MKKRCRGRVINADKKTRRRRFLARRRRRSPPSPSLRELSGLARARRRRRRLKDTLYVYTPPPTRDANVIRVFNRTRITCAYDDRCTGNAMDTHTHTHIAQIGENTTRIDAENRVYDVLTRSRIESCTSSSDWGSFEAIGQCV